MSGPRARARNLHGLACAAFRGRKPPQRHAVHNITIFGQLAFWGCHAWRNSFPYLVDMSQSDHVLLDKSHLPSPCGQNVLNSGLSSQRPQGLVSRFVLAISHGRFLWALGLRHPSTIDGNGTIGLGPELSHKLARPSEPSGQGCRHGETFWTSSPRSALLQMFFSAFGCGHGASLSNPPSELTLVLDLNETWNL
jgi:hypothetical protein